MNADSVQLHATLEEIVYRNENNAYTVIEVSWNDTLVTCVGELPDMSPGEKLILTGSWTNHHSFGRQFRVERFERYLPETAAQYLKYLSSGAIKGIGPATARKIVNRFGESTFSVIENEPERLAVINGITKDRAKLISAEFKRQFAVRTVIIDLERYGFTPTECLRIYKLHGSQSVNLFKENPYILCGELETYSFERAEKVAGMLDEKPDQKHRCRAGIIHVLKHNEMNGHTALPRHKVASLAAGLLDLPEDEIDSTIDDMVANKMLFEYSAKVTFVALPVDYSAEKKIAERIDLLMRFSPLEQTASDELIDKIQKSNEIEYNEKQRYAIKLAAEKGMLILTGGPGTGKTTTVKGIIGYFEKMGLEIALAAPTGRAAKRMTELTGRDAKTIHRLLEVEWNDNDEQSFKKNESSPLTADVIIIDETSMVDVFLFSHLLEAVRFGARLILVGDTDQLPAVGPGNVLSDITASGKVPVVALNEIFRQAQESLIVMNAHDIINGKMPQLKKTDSDFFFIKRENPDFAVRTVVSLYAERLPNAYGYSPMKDIQVLCPSRKGDMGTINLNRIIRDVVNPPDENKREFHAGGKLFREGDKIMQVKNNYDILWEMGGDSGAGLFNGDMGVIQKLDTQAGTMTVDFDDGKIVSYPLEFISDLEPAYAVTVHKSQGSEYNAVIMPLLDVFKRLSYRNLLYTAVTRARKQMIIVGDEYSVAQMVENNTQSKRYSLLKNMLTREENQ